MSKPYFSVIVPVLNEESEIKKLMESLVDQTFKDFEFILVDAGSTDNTVKIVSSYSKKLNLKIVETKVRNVPFSRNLGAKKAQADFFVFIDGDNQITKGFLEATKSCIRKYNCQLIIPKLEPDNKSLLNKILYYLSNKLISIMLHTPRIYTTGGNIIVSRKYFDKVKGFDPKIKITDDQDFVRRAHKSGAKVKFLNDEGIVFSTRRFEVEGFAAYFKYIYSFFYLLVFDRIEKDIYSYKLGGDYFKNEK